MNKGIFFIATFLLMAIGVWAQIDFNAEVELFQQKPDYKNASIGMHVVDVSSQETLFSLNQNMLLIPASTMKLISSASALEILGADYRFQTKIAYSGNIDKNGILNGDLLLIGGGDPTLGSEHFQNHYFDFLQNWAHKIRAAGIKKVNGNLILDASIFDTERVPDTWIWGDIGNYYGAGANAFTVYDNLFRITFQSPKGVGKATKVIATYPKIEGLTITNEVLTADNNSDNAYVFGGTFDKKRVIRGTIPRNRKAFTIKAAIHQPEEILAQEFRNTLATQGTFIVGKTKFEKVNAKKIETIYVQESPTLSSIAEVLNHKSVNLFAEHFLKQIAVDQKGSASRNKAIELLKTYWTSKGVSTENIFIHDGSGLSHFNAVSPEFFTQLLLKMQFNESFVNSLPNAGEGTLTRFQKSLLPGKTMQAKSGSMTRVRCYAGYLKMDSGKTVAFSFMFNHFSGSHTALIKEIEHLLVTLKAVN